MVVKPGQGTKNYLSSVFLLRFIYFFTIDYRIVLSKENKKGWKYGQKRTIIFAMYEAGGVHIRTREYDNSLIRVTFHDVGRGAAMLRENAVRVRAP